MKVIYLEDDGLSRLATLPLLQEYAQVSSYNNITDFYSNWEAEYFDLALIDLYLESEQANGRDLIRKLRPYCKRIIILTGSEDKKEIQTCYELGCDDYIVKPISQKLIHEVVEKVSLQNKVHTYLGKLGETSLNIDGFEENSKTENREQNFFQLLARMQASRSLFLHGETGTGKTKFSKEISEHFFSGEFVHLNCAEIAENLLESELFGHVKGAFTGAHQNKIGKIELAHDGVLFLDEVTSLKPCMQRKLLRVIEEKEFYSVGSNIKKHSNFILISATCDDYNEMLRVGSLRKDFYFRISMNEVGLRPLRENRHEILRFLSESFSGGRQVIFADSLREFFKKYSFPGNYRELISIINFIKNSRTGIAELTDLPKDTYKRYLKGKKLEALSFRESDEDQMLNIKKNGLKVHLKQIEKEVVEKVFKQNDRQVRKTLRDLKISNSSFYRILGKALAGEL